MPEPGPALRLTPGDHGLDASFPEQTAIFVVVLATVGEHPSACWRGRPSFPDDRLDTVDQRQQLRDVVAVPAGPRDRQRHPVRVGQQVVL
jgi:hypothetical protein